MPVRRKEAIPCPETARGSQISLGFRDRQVGAVTVLAIGIAVFLVACTSLHKVAMSEDQLHDEIRAGEIFRVGDRVEIVTFDDKQHEIWVTGVDEALVYGEQAVLGEERIHSQRKAERKEVDIPIEDIIGVKTTEFSIGKTAALSSGLYLLVMAMAGAMAAAFLP